MAGTVRHTESFTLGVSDIFFRTAFDIAFRPISFKVDNVETPIKQTFVDANDNVSWYWIAQNPFVEIQSQVPPGAGTVIDIIYESTLNNLEGATTPGAISTLANINDPQAPGPNPNPDPPDDSLDYTPAGNSGIFTTVVDSPSTSTGAGASALATGINRRQSVIPVAINFTTHDPGLRIGQKIPVNRPLHNINADFIILSIVAKPAEKSLGRGSFFRYSCEAVILQEVPTQVPEDTSGITHTITSIYPISPTQPFEQLRSATKLQPPAVRYDQHVFVLGSGGDLEAANPLGNRKFLFENQTFIEAYILPDPDHPPSDQDLVIDVFLDGVSIFSDTKLVVTDGATAPSSTLFRGQVAGFPSYFRAYRGQIMTFSAEYVNIGADPTAAQNVTVQIRGQIT